MPIKEIKPKQLRCCITRQILKHSRDRIITVIDKFPGEEIQTYHFDESMGIRIIDWIPKFREWWQKYGDKS